MGYEEKLVVWTFQKLQNARGVSRKRKERRAPTVVILTLQKMCPSFFRARSENAKSAGCLVTLVLRTVTGLLQRNAQERLELRGPARAHPGVDAALARQEARAGARASVVARDVPHPATQMR